MCSYGGRIVPRPTDKSHCYLGGETRIIVVDSHSSLADLSTKLSRSLLGDSSFSLKYQFPNEELDSLNSVTTNEDLNNISRSMIASSNHPPTQLGPMVAEATSVRAAPIASASSSSLPSQSPPPRRSDPSSMTRSPRLGLSTHSTVPWESASTASSPISPPTPPPSTASLTSRMTFPPTLAASAVESPASLPPSSPSSSSFPARTPPESSLARAGHPLHPGLPNARHNIFLWIHLVCPLTLQPLWTGTA